MDEGEKGMKVKYATMVGLLGLAASVSYGTMPPCLVPGAALRDSGLLGPVALRY